MKPQIVAHYEVDVRPRSWAVAFRNHIPPRHNDCLWGPARVRSQRTRICLPNLDGDPKRL